jgi:hypothetical protein
MAIGAANGNAKTSPSIVAEIRRLYSDAPRTRTGKRKYGTLRMIAETFSIPWSRVCEIVYERAWRDVMVEEYQA